MLLSGLSKESESVFVDLLTPHDLEMLKARQNLNANTSVSVPSQSKRYLIITYQGEFDRVHFPLPLAHEDTPNVATLQRVIRKLKRKLNENESSLNDNSVTYRDEK